MAILPRKVSPTICLLVGGSSIPRKSVLSRTISLHHVDMVSRGAALGFAALVQCDVERILKPVASGHSTVGPKYAIVRHVDICYFVGQMPRSDSLGQFEQLVLTAVVTLGENAYGVTIHKRVQELASSEAVTLGAIYVTLDRLEDKGFVSSWLSEPTAARGGRAKRCYKLEGSGEHALKESIATAHRMASSVRSIWGDLDKEFGKA